jgi:hypothetical protein
MSRHRRGPGPGEFPAIPASMAAAEYRCRLSLSERPPA